MALHIFLFAQNGSQEDDFFIDFNYIHGFNDKLSYLRQKLFAGCCILPEEKLKIFKKYRIVL
jgi:hypothetical protein